MSFRGEFANKINRLYQDASLKKKSMDMDWRRIQGYVRSFIEEINEVTEFACASRTEDASELILAVEGCELSFRRHERYIEVLANNQHLDFLHPTTEGYCINYEDKKVLELLDDYMRSAFQSALDELNQM